MKACKSAQDTMKLWAVNICPEGRQPGLTVVAMATSLEDALHQAEQRYPQYFVGGASGYSVEADHAAYDWANRQFNVVEPGRWWRRGFLPDFKPDPVQ